MRALSGIRENFGEGPAKTEVKDRSRQRTKKKIRRGPKKIKRKTSAPAHLPSASEFFIL